jgi:uncharacterized protein involved in exopolysaccharide biosynthesis
MDFNDLIVSFLNVIQKRRILFLLLFVAIFAGAVGGAYVKPARFESTATLLVTLQASRVKTTPSDQQENMVNLQPEEIMAAQVEIMTAREVTEELVDVLPEWVFVSEPSDKWYVRLIVKPLKGIVDWAKDLLIAVKLIEPDNERFNRIKTIEKGLTVFPVRKAQVIEITFRSKNPKVPPVVVEELIDIYKARSAALRSDSQGYELYHERALKLSEELAEAERERTAFLMENDIIDFDSERQQLIARLQVKRLKADEERLRELVSLEPQLNLLNRNTAVLAESYYVYRKAADDRETFFKRDNDISAQMIDAPTVIYQKYTRSRLVLVLMGLAAALVLAALVVVFIEWIARIRQIYRKDVFSSARDVKPPARIRAAE